MLYHLCHSNILAYIFLSTLLHFIFITSSKILTIDFWIVFVIGTATFLIPLSIRSVKPGDVWGVIRSGNVE